MYRLTAVAALAASTELAVAVMVAAVLIRLIGMTQDSRQRL
jgi:hypothetical protein